MSSRPFKVLSANVAKSSYRTHAIHNSSEDYDIVMIQEPYWDRIGLRPSDSSGNGEVILGPTTGG